MTGLCLSGGALTVFLAVESFTLSWVHSVERIEWQEDWRIESRLLVLTDSRVQGHGAGMEPAPGATFDGAWWHSRPHRSLASLALARHSDVEDWRLCVNRACLAVGSYFPALGRSEPVSLQPCEAPPQAQ